jgi:hypothetical protein
MRKLIVLGAAVAALALAGSAAGGGWATIGFAPLPDDLAANTTWQPRITIKQHGVTPLEGLQPLVTIRSSSGDSQQFTAVAASEPGVYVADVVFPSAGVWRLEIDSTFGESRLTYGPFTIGPVAGSPGSDGFPVLVAVVAGLGALGLAVAGLLGARRLRGLSPASG